MCRYLCEKPDQAAQWASDLGPAQNFPSQSSPRKVQTQ